MIKKRLYIYVEGKRDRIFFNSLLNGMKHNYDKIIIKEYSEEDGKLKEDFKMKLKTHFQFSTDPYSPQSTYIFVRDSDGGCHNNLKNKISAKYKNIDIKRILIIRQEIESWYAAIVPDEKAQEFFGKSFKNTDLVAKEHFNNLIPKKFSSEIDFLSEILIHFSLQSAMIKNTSFRYFIETMLPRVDIHLKTTDT